MPAPRLRFKVLKLLSAATTARAKPARPRARTNWRWYSATPPSRRAGFAVPKKKEKEVAQRALVPKLHTNQVKEDAYERPLFFCANPLFRRNPKQTTCNQTSSLKQTGTTIGAAIPSAHTNEPGRSTAAGHLRLRANSAEPTIIALGRFPFFWNTCRTLPGILSPQSAIAFTCGCFSPLVNQVATSMAPI